MKLLLNGEVIWENPKELGHFGIKLRKQLYEEELVRRLIKASPSDEEHAVSEAKE